MLGWWHNRQPFAPCPLGGRRSRACYNHSRMPRQQTRRGYLLVAGDINLDLMARIPKFTGLGGDYLAPSLALQGGGASVRLLGATGKDWFGRYILSRLRRRGVDIACVQQIPSVLTGLLLVVVSRGQQRTFF